MRRLSRTLGMGLVGSLIYLMPTPATSGDEPVKTTIGFDEFLVIPLRVHILKSSELPELDCKLKDRDVTRILGKVNKVWHRAGIHWAVESVVRESAAREEAFQEAKELRGEPRLGTYSLLRPDPSRAFDGLHVYYVHEFPVNGVWMGSDFVFVRETAHLTAVDGGIDEPVPRVTAHELGHALGLVHRQDRANLLASGTTGTLLNASEVETARARARRIKGVKTAAILRADALKAERSGEVDVARRTWSSLKGIPGIDTDKGDQRDKDDT